MWMGKYFDTAILNILAKTLLPAKVGKLPVTWGKPLVSSGTLMSSTVNN